MVSSNLIYRKMVPPHPNSMKEPIELRLLKQRLACTSCKCARFRDKITTQLEAERDKQVQAIDLGVPMDHYLQKLLQEYFAVLRDNKLVLKDEQMETEKAMFFQDKSTTKPLLLIDSTTSTTNNTTLNTSTKSSNSELFTYYNVFQKEVTVTEFKMDSSIINKYIDAIRPPVLNY